MENLGITNMMKELKKLNPQAKFDAKTYCVPAIIRGSVPAESLALPVGYEYNTKNGITNKHKTQSGLYECFDYICSAD